MSPMPQFLKDMAKVVTKGEAIRGTSEKRMSMGGFAQREPDPGIFGQARKLTRPRLRKELNKGPRQYNRKERFERAERLLKDMGSVVTPGEVSKKIKILKRVAKRPTTSISRKTGLKKDIKFLETIKGNQNEK